MDLHAAVEILSIVSYCFEHQLSQVLNWCDFLAVKFISCFSHHSLFEDSQPTECLKLET